MEPKDYPAEFEQDLIDLGYFENPRRKRITPDPIVEEIIRGQANREFIMVGLVGACILVLMLWLIPAS
jgi:hypothetical protein